MRDFRFRLEKVLSWRRTEQRAAEAKLEGLRMTLRALRAEQARVISRREEAQTAVYGSSSILGSDLAILETARRWALSEFGRIARAASELETAIAAQVAATTQAQARVKLIEKLKDRQQADWSLENARELDVLAGEFAVARWLRDRA